MPDNLESILFLAILVLFPIAFIAMIVALIVRNVRKQRGFAALAKNNGWKQLENDSGSALRVPTCYPTPTWDQPKCGRTVNWTMQGGACCGQRCSSCT